MLLVAIEEKSAGGKLRASLLVKVENEYGSYEAPIIATYKLTNIFPFEVKTGSTTADSLRAYLARTNYQTFFTFSSE